MDFMSTALYVFAGLAAIAVMIFICMAIGGFLKYNDIVMRRITAEERKKRFWERRRSNAPRKFVP